MERLFLVGGAVAGFLGVALGAFGAHALQQQLDQSALSNFETAVRYHLVHAVVLVLVGMLARAGGGGVVLAWSGFLFFGGMVVFSGSLYLLAVTGTSWLGAITPIGGVALLGGWALLAVAGWRAIA